MEWLIMAIVGFVVIVVSGWMVKAGGMILLLIISFTFFQMWQRSLKVALPDLSTCICYCLLGYTSTVIPDLSYFLWCCDILNQDGCQHLDFVVDVLHCYIFHWFNYFILKQVILIGQQRLPNICGVDNVWDCLG